MSLLSSTLNSLTFFFQEECYSLFTIFVAFCWTCTSTSISLVHLGAQDWIQHSIHYFLWRKVSGQTQRLYFCVWLGNAKAFPLKHL